MPSFNGCLQAALTAAMHHLCHHAAFDQYSSWFLKGIYHFILLFCIFQVKDCLMHVRADSHLQN